MQKGHTLHFNCLSCSEPVKFSLFEHDGQEVPIVCDSCQKTYRLDDDNLLRQLRKFEALCSQIAASEEILGAASIGVNVGDHLVKIPYKLLLTRLNSSIDLRIGDQPVSIQFRLEPGTDVLKSGGTPA